MAFFGAAPFGSLLAGALAHRIGAPHTVIVTGACASPARYGSCSNCRKSRRSCSRFTKSAVWFPLAAKARFPPCASRHYETFPPKGLITVNWYNYVACFFAGMFLANAVPHFVNGISGDPFPTPFAHPPGQGLSSPTVNVVWALANLVAGYALFRAGKIASGSDWALAVFFAGIALVSTLSSVHFAKKQAS